jgi:hypothetical protein
MSFVHLHVHTQYSIPSMLSGWLQESLGYTQFFWAAVACTVPGMILSMILWKGYPRGVKE